MSTTIQETEVSVTEAEPKKKRGRAKGPERVETSFVDYLREFSPSAVNADGKVVEPVEFPTKNPDGKKILRPTKDDFVNDLTYQTWNLTFKERALRKGLERLEKRRAWLEEYRKHGNPNISKKLAKYNALQEKMAEIQRLLEQEGYTLPKK